MARVLSQAAILARRLGAQPRTGGALGLRHSHTRRPVAEVDAAGPSTTAEGAALSRRLEEAIDGALARLAEPDWAPFRPGTSYFAPPRPAGTAVEILELIKQARGVAAPRPGLSADEARAVAYASRGYPCSAYFIDGHFPDEGGSSKSGC